MGSWGGHVAQDFPDGSQVAYALCVDGGSGIRGGRHPRPTDSVRLEAAPRQLVEGAMRCECWAASGQRPAEGSQERNAPCARPISATTSPPVAFGGGSLRCAAVAGPLRGRCVAGIASPADVETPAESFASGRRICDVRMQMEGKSGVFGRRFATARRICDVPLQMDGACRR